MELTETDCLTGHNHLEINMQYDLALALVDFPASLRFSSLMGDR